MIWSSLKTKGFLLDIEDKTILAELFLVISSQPHERPVFKQVYKITGTIDGNKPELNNKKLILKLTDTVFGKVLVKFRKNNTFSQTKVEIFLRDPFWKETKWYDSLNSNLGK
jgi:hypothetical protein